MPRRTVYVLCFAVAMAAVSWPRQARAELPAIAGSVFGGEVSTTQRGALSLGTGWPSFFVQYDFHTSGRFGIGLRTDMFYGNPAWGWDFGFGWGFNVPMRINVLDRNDWALAITIDPGIWMGFGDRWVGRGYDDDWFIFGPRIGAGIVASVNPVDPLIVFFGLRLMFNILVYSHENFDAWADLAVGIMPFGGVELAVHRQISLFFHFTAGPTVGSEDWCSDWNREGECTNWHHDLWVHANFQFYFGATFHFGR